MARISKTTGSQGWRRPPATPLLGNEDLTMIFSRQCRGKRAYTTLRQAKVVLRVMVKEHPDRAESLTTYRCRSCHKIHIGNNKWAVKKA